MPLKWGLETKHFFSKVDAIKELLTHRLSARWVGQRITGQSLCFVRIVNNSLQSNWNVRSNMEQFRFSAAFYSKLERCYLDEQE
jgi:hypothetical protein